MLRIFSLHYLCEGWVGSWRVIGLHQMLLGRGWHHVLCVRILLFFPVCESNTQLLNKQ